jgi:ribosomal protein S18 acetylase RimI-like enzyme
VQALREHHKLQAAGRLKAGSLWQDHGLVFASSIGTPLDRRNVLREFRKIAAALKSWTGCSGESWPCLDSAPHAGFGHDEYASAVRIEPLPERLYDAAIRLWQDSGLTRPWNDPEADLRRAAGGGSSCVLAAIGDDDGLLATAMVGHDGHRGWVYYLAVGAAQRGRGLGRQMMQACEDWVRSRGIPKIQLMVRATNRGTIGFYEHLGYADSDVVVLGRRLDG